MRRAAIALVLAVLAVLAGAAGPASAHNFLVSATPAPGSTVTAQPSTIVVTTNDVLLKINGTEGFGMLVQDSDGRFYGDGCVTVTGPSISMDAQLGAAGTYKVTWQVISTDSHPVSGSFTFTWKPSSDQQLAAGAASRPVCAQSSTDGSATNAPQASTPTEESTGSSDTTIWWIIGAIAAVAVAVVVVLLVARPRRREDGDEEDAAPRE